MSDAKTPAETRLIWIDLETMGLAHDAPIVEAAVLITDSELRPITPGSEPAQSYERIVPYARAEWGAYAEPVAFQMHHDTGLCGLSEAEFENPDFDYERTDIETRMEALDADLLEFVVRAGFKSREGVLAGSSIHSDRAWLRTHCPRFESFLHYRMVDVSSLKELVKRWLAPDISEQLQKRRGRGTRHRAMDDIKASIEELRIYRDHIFRENDLKAWLAMEPT